MGLPKKTAEKGYVPNRIVDLDLTLYSKPWERLSFMLEQDKAIPDNVVPRDNIALKLTESDGGFLAEFFCRWDIGRPYERPLPNVPGCCIWRWEETLKEFYRPFGETTGYTNLKEILDAILIFNPDNGGAK